MSYGTGAIMAVPAHDTRDWEFAKKFGLPIIEVVQGGNVEQEAYTDCDTGVMVNSGILDGLSVEEAKKKIIGWLSENKKGEPKVNFKLRDWVFSRQRYWGEPIPIIHCLSLIHIYVLESGIDIFVQPPGKIIKNLSALSGGEQAFVAIAIYFAILKVRPSPFCLLDEIEAALDDVNVVKYAQYLRTLCDKTQFITITHRRGTMEEADVLYGLTMQEEGGSKLRELNVGEIEDKLGIQ